MNLCVLKGNITRDIEMRHTPSGVAVVEFGVAINRRWTTNDGEKKDSVTFVDCRAWREVAEAVHKHFSKGAPILIQGELAQEEWEDRETGKKRRKTLVLVNRWEFCGEKRERAAPEEPEGRAGAAGPPERPQAAPKEAGDVPF